MKADKDDGTPMTSVTDAYTQEVLFAAAAAAASAATEASAGQGTPFDE